MPHWGWWQGQGQAQADRNTMARQSLRLREHPDTGPFIEGLREVEVRTPEEMTRLIQQGLAARTTATTGVSASSSRSHAVFTLTLTQTRTAAASDADVQLPCKVRDLYRARH